VGWIREANQAHFENAPLTPAIPGVIIRFRVTRRLTNVSPSPAVRRVGADFATPVL
jgi:hypothetical protein